MSGNFSLKYHLMNTLQWKVDQFTGSGLELSDSSVQKLGKLGKLVTLKPAVKGQKHSKVLVPRDDFLLI